ncbi:hypothetical protein ACLOJK_038270 [Asimina triloba]
MNYCNRPIRPFPFVVSLFRASSSSAFVRAFPIPPSPFHASTVSFSGLSSDFPALTISLLPLPSESRPHPTPTVFLASSPFRPSLLPPTSLLPLPFGHTLLPLSSLLATPFRPHLTPSPFRPHPAHLRLSRSSAFCHLDLPTVEIFHLRLCLHLSPPPPPSLHLAPPPPSRALPPAVEMFRRDLLSRSVVEIWFSSRSAVEICCRDLVSVEICRRDLVSVELSRRD